MKRLSNIINNILIKIWKIFYNTIIIVINPFFEISNQITRKLCKSIQNNFKIDTKAIIKILDNAERLVITSSIFY